MSLSWTFFCLGFLFGGGVFLTFSTESIGFSVGLLIVVVVVVVGSGGGGEDESIHRANVPSEQRVM